jgi:Carboxylesterase.
MTYMLYYFNAGVSHSDDLIYLFPESEPDLNSQDKRIAQIMVELWTNFATYR